MAGLIYTTLGSLDGYHADEQGNFAWAAPDEEVHAFVNDLERPVGTYLYGRRLYEVMRYWETAHTEPDQSPVALDYAHVWQSADKIVYSTTLDAVSSARTRIERTFDPQAVRAMKDSTDREISIGGPTLAVHAFRAGLIDEIRMFLAPVVIGAGTRILPEQVRLNLGLLQERRFGTGFVYLRYRVAN